MACVREHAPEAGADVQTGKRVCVGRRPAACVDDPPPWDPRGMPAPQDARMPSFRDGLFLAPMVRIGSLPTRLLALEYGARLVWGPEVVDRAIMGAARRVNAHTGEVEFVKGDRQVFSCHAIERPYLIFQVGSATPAQAAEAVTVVTAHDDVAGVDLNCGCPKPFSTLGGMGANLLATPDVLCDILVAMRRAAPPHVSVSAKIRLLPTQSATLDLVERIVRTRTVRAITVHCRTKDMRPREPALLERLAGVADHIAKTAAETRQEVHVVCNGDCFSATDAARIRARTGAAALMLARGPETNPSCFSATRVCAATEIAPKWLRYAAWFGNPFGNTKYCMTQLALSTTAGGTARISPLSKRELVAMRAEMSRSKTHEDIARALRIPWPMDVDGDVLGALRAVLAGAAAGGGGDGGDGKRAVVGQSGGQGGDGKGDV
ncbi:tRNA-dihydrouridine(20) synthase [NAD(P)(+)] [Malassezia sp. CBS 17886]|nr:tRNA-dihydrouridine(20) synthase [NAD(P)(+)] [Malassezia sp. CBS 17886]